jgi:hypothetical protein
VRETRAFRVAGQWLLILLLAMMVTGLRVYPTQAAARTLAGLPDTITLSLTNGSAFVYGQNPQPNFTAVVVFGTHPTANLYWGVKMTLEDGEAFSSNNSTSSPDGMTLTFPNVAANSLITVGQHTAVASFYNAITNTTVYSNSVGFTISKAPPLLNCSFVGDQTHFEAAGQTLHIAMTPTAQHGSEPVDWQDTTYSVTFQGSTTTTDTNLVPDGNDTVTVTAPATPGMYGVTCVFNGTHLFLSTSTLTGKFMFSEEHSLGSVQLYSNPTTVDAQDSMEFYIVFQAAAGLPTPTGEIAMYIGQSYSRSIMLGPSGTVLVTFSPLQSLIGAYNVQIKYFGDANYTVAQLTFPLTNPPIPPGIAGGSGGGSSTPAPSAQPTATQAPGAEPTTTATTNSTLISSNSGGATNQPGTVPAGGSSSVPLLLIILGLFVVLALAGGTGGAIYVVRRSQAERYDQGRYDQGRYDQGRYDQGRYDQWYGDQKFAPPPQSRRAPPYPDEQTNPNEYAYGDEYPYGRTDPWKW